ncbi:No apical meristem-associated C-terminal domain [Fragilaria crotonensis]|nr:No apical meristem-associated C-terminal domain [Fragilaria crotonensis]
MLVANGVAPVRRVNAGNFTKAEDGFLAHAFVTVSTNAAVGTDQDGKMFWTRITEDFVRRGGGPTRSSNSLKTRFNRTLQHDVNKYIGHLQGALREYHSGWVIVDYTNKANDDFERVEEKRWKQAHVYEILRRGLPKFELVTQTMHPRVLNALFLLDCDRMSPESGSDDDDEEDAVGVSNVPAAARGFGLTPRPSIGKKRAKLLAQQAAAIKLKKTKKDDPPEPDKVFSFNQVLKHRQNESLERLAFAAEAKANVAKEQYMFNFYTKNPASAASIAWFAAKELEYAPAVPTERATTGGDVPDVINVDAEDPADDADDDKESYIDENGLFVPGGYVRDVALDNIIASIRPPNAIAGLDQTTNTSSDDSQEDSEWDTLPPTQRLVLAFNNAIVDSQATTLTN